MQQNVEQKTKAILSKKFTELPVAKDLPRLAKKISIENGDRSVLLSPSESVKVPDYLYNIFKTMFHALEEKENEENLESGWKMCYDEKRELEKILDRYLTQYVSEGSKALQVLKACNQGVISTAVIELKTALGVQHPTKDVSNQWQFKITLEPSVIKVSSNKREICIQGVFEFEWEFVITFSRETLTCTNVSLCVVDIVIHKPENTSKIEEVKRILSRYQGKEKTQQEKLENELIEDTTLDFLLSGEKIIMQDNFVTQIITENLSVFGTIFITNFRIYFLPNNRNVKKPLFYFNFNFFKKKEN
jgi:hypothetical protein